MTRGYDRDNRWGVGFELGQKEHHYNYSRLVTHKASTKRFHLSRSAAIIRNSFHVFQPTSSLSFSTVRFQVVFGLPLLLFPSVAQVYIVMLQSLFWSCLSICPIIFHLRHFNSSLSGFMSALSNNSSVLTCSCQWIWRILRRHLLSGTHQLLCSLLVHFPVFQL